MDWTTALPGQVHVGLVLLILVPASAVLNHSLQNAQITFPLKLCTLRCTSSTHILGCFV